MAKAHTFHIPVMGIGFTIDTPLKVSKFGIDSVISLVDDMLAEKIRKMYCEKFNLTYQEITNKNDDFRAKRFTSYLNLINDLAEKTFEDLKTKGSEVKEYINLLPDTSEIKKEFKVLTSKYFNIDEISSWVNKNLSIGSIDVNIMTKVDKENYKKGEKLPIEYNDAFAAVRGYAQSNLKSSLVLSAGMNPRLYGYMEEFEDFYPNENGEIKKKIVLKVSDYRSALIQGRFFAKKGLWVSEYRIESGLNCGGHAFATDGFLMGSILKEFKDHKKELHDLANDVIKQALINKNKTIPKKELEFRITAQGGVGTHEEHEFLMDYYGIDKVGWASPFLLVPEVSNVDAATKEKLVSAKEKDLYVSDVSPLGVKFNSLRNNTKDIEKNKFIAEGKAGSTCPKRYLISNKDYTEKPICTASRQFQKIKINELKTKALSEEEYKKEFHKITEKECICVGLGTAALMINNLDTKIEGHGVSICPGPNLAYFSREMSMKEMIDHIYGRANVISRNDRPNLFVKELNIYLEFLKDKIQDAEKSMTVSQEKYLKAFSKNLNDGIEYYQSLFADVKNKFDDIKSSILNDLENNKIILQKMFVQIENLSVSSK